MLNPDRIYFLKSASIFTEIPDGVLGEIAELLEELEVDSGEAIFKKGDPGSSLFIIVSGRVRVHDGELTLNHLGKMEVFGEMSALDPQPRSATVTAVEKTVLFCLEREPLFNLISEHPEISQEIIHILSQRLRARMRDMAEDFQYIQQFERVISAAVAVESGIYEPDSLDEVARRTDELGQLARVFQRMEREIYSREQRLKQEVAELRIEIDEVNKAHQVKEITETEYFQELKLKAYQLRSEHHQDKGSI
jgi:CRP-like cAMP-binding protein